MLNEIYERSKRLVQESVFCLFNSGWEVFHSTPEGEQAYDEAFEVAYERYEEREIEHIQDVCEVELDELTTDHLETLEDLGDYDTPWADLFDEDEFLVDDFKERLRDSFFESKEPMQFWLVDDWLARQLVHQSEIVILVYGLNIWVRCACGQAVAMDCAFMNIASQLMDANP